jgi:putative membrane protein
MRWLLGILINAILFIALAGFFKNSFYIEDFFSSIGASFILAILNIFVKPILIILTLPVTMLSLGLFLFVINAFTLLLTDSIMGSSFEIKNFGMAFIIAVIMSVVNLIIQSQLNRKKIDR